MSDGARLRALWALDEPPARDVSFEFQVMQRLLRRRLWTDIAALVPLAVGGGVALWALVPLLGSLDQLATADTEALVGLGVSLGIAVAVFVIDMVRTDSA